MKREEEKSSNRQGIPRLQRGEKMEMGLSLLSQLWNGAASYLAHNSMVDLLAVLNVVVWGAHFALRRELRREEVRVRVEPSVHKRSR